MAKKVPTFLVGGFLDGGKTSYIIHTLKTDAQADKYKTLLIVCEQGEIEYDEAMLNQVNTTIKYVDSIEEFNGNVIEKAIKEVKPDRLIVELNGMWKIEDLDLPKVTEVIQTIIFIDGSTFGVYFNNMRQNFTDMIKYAQVVCFTKVKDAKAELGPYQNPLKLINQNVYFYTVDENMKVDDAFEIPLPYDINAPVISVKEEDYATFYIDTYEKHERYEGKIVEFDAMTFISDKFTDNSFLVGRWIMNCCANDTQLYGFPAHIIGDTCPVQNKEWIHIKAKITYEWSEQYQEEECFLTPIEITRIEPREEVLNLTGQPQQ